MSPSRSSLFCVCHTHYCVGYTQWRMAVKEPMDERRATPDCPRASRRPGGCAGARAKGPKPGLSLERIVAAAVEVAATEGLAAVSMSRVAAELGSSTMSLYRYVAAKDELFALMVDAALGDAPAAPAPGRGLAGRAVALGVGLPRRPAPPPLGPARSRSAGRRVTPNQIAWMEDGLSALRRHRPGRGREALGDAAGQRLRPQRGDARPPTSRRRAAPGARSMPQLGAARCAADRPRALPRAPRRARLGRRSTRTTTRDDEFVFGLERILDGIEALIAARR